jgi:5-methylthioadenosine/S-adenosylhomocysteine deaminase
MDVVDLIILNGFIYTGNRENDEIPHGSIAVKGNKIFDIGETDDILSRCRSIETIDAGGQFIFPGFTNTHDHLFQVMMKGLGEGIHVHSWINSVTIPGLLQMKERDFYLSAKAACLDAIRSGTTTLVEYMYPHNRHEMGDAILNGMVDSGIRGFIGRGLADIGATQGDILRNAYFAEFLEPIDILFNDCERLWNECGKRGQSRIQFCLAPPYFRCLSPGMLAMISDFAKTHDCLITMHLYETIRDNEVALEQYGMSAAEWLEKNNFLGPNLLAVHCVNIDNDAIDRFAANQVKVSYNPVSNMYLGNGTPPIPKMIQKGIVVGLGSDGAASNNSQDMIEVMKTGVLLQRAMTRSPQILTGRDAFRMATIDGAVSLGLSNAVGSLEIGKKADIVLADFSVLKSAPYYDPINTLVFSSDPRVIRTVVIDGVIVLKDGDFVSVDEGAIIREIQEAGLALAKRSYSREILKHSSALK